MREHIRIDEPALTQRTTRLEVDFQPERAIVRDDLPQRSLDPALLAQRFHGRHLDVEPVKVPQEPHQEKPEGIFEGLAAAAGKPNPAAAAAAPAALGERRDDAAGRDADFAAFSACVKAWVAAS